MANKSLVDELETTFEILDRHLRQHREAEAYLQAQARLAYLQLQIDRLHCELLTLKRISASLAQLSGDAQGIALWQRTQIELRRKESRELRSPGRALVGAGVDLLQLACYTGAAISLTTERRARLTESLNQCLQQRRDEVARKATGTDRESRSQELLTQIDELGAQLERLDEELSRATLDTWWSQVCALTKALQEEWQAS